MKADRVELSPTRFAQVVAPAISRAFVSGMRPDERLRRVVREHCGPAAGFMIDLRNPLAAGRPVSTADLAALYRYTDPDEIRLTMAGTVAHGLLSEESADGYRPTAAGRAFLDDLLHAQGITLAERWGSPAHVVCRLNDTLATVLAEAAASGGPALQAQAPPYEPDGTPAELILLNRISTLRYHRSDAHATAWHAVGMTAAEVAAQPWGTAWTPQRVAAEDRTNALAGRPFAVLDPDARLQLLADLAALP